VLDERPFYTNVGAASWVFARNPSELLPSWPLTRRLFDIADNEWTLACGHRCSAAAFRHHDGRRAAPRAVSLERDARRERLARTDPYGMACSTVHRGRRPSTEQVSSS
jgi:hypothetical protein